MNIKIKDRLIGPGNPVWIIAEVGINHGGDHDLCAEMISAAAMAGADAVKLQTVTPDISYHPDTASYETFKSATLTKLELTRLMEHAVSEKVVLFSTPGDIPALQMIKSVGMSAIKISSGLLTNTPLIREAARTGLPLIMSTGMAYLNEIESALNAAYSCGAKELSILQCTSLYPAPPESLNLGAISVLRNHFHIPVGYSDHHDGDLACIAAVAMGACIIEKHFTMDRSLPGADHSISLDPTGFKSMVNHIRSLEKMVGSIEQKPTKEEIELRQSRHRCLVASRNIGLGDTIREADVHLMRVPENIRALSADNLSSILGRKASCNIPYLTGILPEMIDNFN